MEDKFALKALNGLSENKKYVQKYPNRLLHENKIGETRKCIGQ
jgi:hypothetical protein